MNEPDTTTEFGVLRDTRLADIDDALRRLCPGETMLDIGSGMGAVVALAQLRGAKAHGVEIDPDLFARSLSREQIENVDAVRVSIDWYGILYYYLEGSPDEGALLDRLASEASDVVLIYHRGCEAVSVERARAVMAPRFELATEGCLDIWTRKERDG